MASLSEIHEPSNLRYDTSLGFTNADSGQGLPIFLSSEFGWYRTGSESSVLVNCAAWTRSHEAFGHALLRVGLPSDTWAHLRLECSIPQRVWCVQD